MIAQKLCPNQLNQRSYCSSQPLTTSAVANHQPSAPSGDAAGSARPDHAPAVAVNAGQRGPLQQPHVLAIDVDADAAAQAEENAGFSPWRDVITVQQISLQRLVEVASGAAADAAAAEGLTDAHLGPYDLIISNPPYFVNSSKPAAGRDGRAAARHADVGLPFPDLARGAAALLAPGGCVCVVLPPAEAEAFVEEAEAAGLALVERVRVFTAPEDARERRQLLRLRRAAELSVPPAPAPAPNDWSLTMNGPLVTSPSTPTSTSASTPASTLASSPAASSSSPAPAPAPAPKAPKAPARYLTAAYLRLTQDFHDPAYLAPHWAALGQQPHQADPAPEPSAC
ncbi:hypothetical protein HYH03_010631 [Edaphochlamys debaryana]|uniref:Uncharacterized protein n=1 Tax=Edaphochlamys debaryana TaxID=47281 RepID=A0A835Y4M8_9CHLO|nr:hypothetical protein HYH03_010631 [Edaphochlamys debaryana]|eukprot:KAG2490954.1 hypothetical protein HYH03_010631 [Edaphochlamys debaryana]